MPFENVFGVRGQAGHKKCRTRRALRMPGNLLAQELAPSFVEYVPASQDTHEDESFDKDEPASQDTHALHPGREYSAVPQGEQSALLIEPVKFKKVELLHGVQALAPVYGMYVPSPHNEQAYSI